jgi:hypothetical protein
LRAGFWCACVAQRGVEDRLTEDGLEVTAGGGTVAGVPTGPVGQLITAAIVARL